MNQFAIKQLIPAQIAGELTETPYPGNDTSFLEVSEFFYDTIQGEGVYAGHPAAFLRLKGCTLNCSWCDTQEVWRTGYRFSFAYLFHLIENSTLLEKLRKGQHLVITGGSPLRQQYRLIAFIRAFIDKFHFTPFIEVENECVLLIDNDLLPYVRCWNNSPKLANSGNAFATRVNDKALQQAVSIGGYFKFVVSSEEDVDEVFLTFVIPYNIPLARVLLMPLGQTAVDIALKKAEVIGWAIKYNVRYSPRLHVELWDKQTGV